MQTLAATQKPLSSKYAQTHTAFCDAVSLIHHSSERGSPYLSEALPQDLLTHMLQIEWQHNSNVFASVIAVTMCGGE